MTHNLFEMKNQLCLDVAEIRLGCGARLLVLANAYESSQYSLSVSNHIARFSGKLSDLCPNKIWSCPCTEIDLTHTWKKLYDLWSFSYMLRSTVELTPSLPETSILILSIVGLKFVPKQTSSSVKPLPSRSISTSYLEIINDQKLIF